MAVLRRCAAVRPLCVHRPLSLPRFMTGGAFTDRIPVYEVAKQCYFEEVISNSKANSFRIECAELPQIVNVDAGWRPIEALKYLPKPSTDDDQVVAVSVNGRIHGLGETIASIVYEQRNKSSADKLQLSFVRFLSPHGKRVFWHSAAHVVGAALEGRYGTSVNLTDGPPLLDAEGGFFYEMHFVDPALRMSEESFPGLEEAARHIVAARHPFEKIAVSRSTAAALFTDNPFKLDMLERIPADERVTVYRCGPFIDLCRGPHLPNTGLLKHTKLHKSSGSHWQSTGRRPEIQGALLQRVYGVAFPTSSGLQSWVSRLETARRRDHRVIGLAQQLFTFHDVSPGSVFLLPHGARIYNRLLQLMRTQYRARGYDEVITPQLYKRGLWRASGHGAAYADNMYAVTPGLPQNGWPEQPKGEEGATGHSHGHSHGVEDPTDDDVFGLKPMNCPGHCIMFGARTLSYRELPLRMADFSTLHRNEASGALGGLTRLRKFAQDDAHIFCTSEQVQQEVAGCLDFVSAIYGLFGFTFRLKLSTRPEQYVGEERVWAKAEEALGAALQAFLHKNGEACAEGSNTPAFPLAYEVDVGGGAFYGPKIDVFVRDAVGREHQCATVQLDFNLPQRFNLSYKGQDGTALTPVMIHRAIFGSVERFMAVLIEHTGGKWPFWLSPRQVLLCPVAERHIPFASALAQQLMFPMDEPVQSNDEHNRIPSSPGPAIAAPVPSNVIGASLLGRGGSPSSSITTRGGASPDDSCTPAQLHRDSGLWVEVDESTRSVGKKVREGQVAAWSLLVVVGDAEEKEGKAAVRFRDAATHDAFVRAWGDVRPVDAQSGAQSAKPAPAKRIATKPASLEEECSTDAVYNSPLVSLPFADFRAVCERMVKLYL